MIKRIKKLLRQSELGALVVTVARYLAPSHKRQLWMVSALAASFSVVEMLTALMVIPYVQCVGGQCSERLTGFLDGFLGGALVGALGGSPLILMLTLALFGLITLKFVLQGLLAWRGAKFHQQVQRDTVSRLLHGYLHLNWKSLKSKNRAHYLRRCFTTALDASFVSQQCVTLIASSFMLFFLSMALLWDDPVTGVFVALGLMSLGALSQKLISRVQNRTAHERELATQRWNVDFSEALGSFREIRVHALEDFFLKRLDLALGDVAKANQKMTFLPHLPRMLLDYVLFASLLLLMFFWVYSGRAVAEILPQIFFYAFVLRALLPALINLASTRAVLAGSIINIELILEEFAANEAGAVDRIEVPPRKSDKDYFALKDISYRHSKDLSLIIDRLSLCLQHRSWVALVGPSGVGKSTLLELLCGINEPQSGEVIHAWSGKGRPKIAYLPQQVALLDGTIAENVVFGFDTGDINRIDQALELASLSRLVSKLPAGRDARIGAEAAQISGGERQRLALARALYREPDLLLMDEATSGLDEETETRVLSRLKQSRPNMSVIFVTHRQSSLLFADDVIAIEPRDH